MNILKVNPEFHCGIQKAYSFCIGMCKPINELVQFFCTIHENYSVCIFYVRWIVFEMKLLYIHLTRI